jgi:hypothetical protein
MRDADIYVKAVDDAAVVDEIDALHLPMRMLTSCLRFVLTDAIVAFESHDAFVHLRYRYPKSDYSIL